MHWQNKSSHQIYLVDIDGYGNITDTKHHFVIN